MLNNMREGMGTEFFSEEPLNRRSYNGMWGNDLQNGAGTSFDPETGAPCTDIWLDGKVGEKNVVVAGVEPMTLSPGVEVLCIAEKSCPRGEKFVFSHFPNLTHLYVGSGACPHGWRLECCHLHHLVTVMIGDGSFAEGPSQNGDTRSFLCRVVDCRAIEGIVFQAETPSGSSSSKHSPFPPWKPSPRERT